MCILTRMDLSVCSILANNLGTEYCTIVDTTPALRPGTESHRESPFFILLLILSEQKNIYYFMQMRAKTICGF